MKIYNTVTRQKENFIPIVENEIGLYSCGVTVYDLCHIGHARTFVAFDTIVRYLRSRGYSVRFVRNITDIDDKIIKRANERNISSLELSQEFIKHMHTDMDSLGLMRPDFEPKATEYMPEMIDLVKGLIEKGYAYKADNGDVYYDVRKKEGYGGRVAHRNLDELESGVRVEVNNDKKDPLDFVLWKSAKPDEPYWESPWGNGRPGWHLECSAMSMSILGETFDIHGGGYDLIFPHHENECAQSEAFTGKDFANYWIHVGFLQINEEKMSKSLGNFFTIRDILGEYHPEVLKYFINSAHYRSQLEYSVDNMKKASQSLERMYIAINDVDISDDDELETSFVDKFQLAMDDDFNTPKALAVLFELVKVLNNAKANSDDGLSRKYAYTLKVLGNTLGILNFSAKEYLRYHNNNLDKSISEKDIEDNIKLRESARASKDWSEADRIRNYLSDNNVLIEDGANGTTWRYKGS